MMEGTAGVVSAPFFSPDSRWIAFAANGTLNKLAVSGGTPIKICTLPLGDDALGFIGGTWAADERIIFAPAFNSGLWEVAASGGTPRLLLGTDVAKDLVAATHPQVLPNGKGILFTSVPGKARTAEDENIAVLERGATEPRVLIEGGSHGVYLPTGQIVYGHGGKLFAVGFDLARLTVIGSAVPVVEGVHVAPPDALYSVSRNGTLVFVPAMKVDKPRLFLLDRKGNRRSITDGTNVPEALAISPDGKTVVARVTAANDDLWTFDINRGSALRLTFEPGDEIYPQWTPDGTRIAYGTRTGTIYWRPADGSGQREELSRGEFARYPSSFSPDGKWLAIVENTATRNRDIWILPIGGGDRQPIAFETTDADEWSPKFSPNGRWIAYVSNESGTTEIYVKPFSGSGGRRRITSDGGQLPIWSRDGRELFFVKAGALMSVGINDDGNTSTTEHVVIEKNAIGDELCSAAQGYDIMPDGQHFLMCLVPPSATPPHYAVIVNWFEEVKRRTMQ
jgi:Tol biopolymer transport system component